MSQTTETVKLSKLVIRLVV